ncbi:MAG: DNA recombination protein RmuC [Acidaminococcus sp.]|nr:DNA recombination protein RmuC [Acidaminococcus sp.]MDD7398843.1 DNA recombination protein RmuC [Bacillota bacterium]MDY4559444.1 DNA recombination protein RmuC [Eubacteriales bacterium]MDY5345357.1 DNA recombination protein RmuC [Eubacteriales bacterium]
MTAIYVLIALTVISIILTAVTLVLTLLKKNLQGGGDLKSALDENAKENKDTLREIKTDIIDTLKMNNEMTVSATTLMSQNVEKEVKSLGDKVATLVDFQQKSTSSLENRMLEFMSNVNAKLEAMRGDNEKQLNKMRETVDEKLSSTLEERFNNSFKRVSEVLGEITQGFAEMQNLKTGVNDLKKIFSNVKQRGTWGEIALDNLLSQILTKEQYSKNVNITKSGDERVDFVINLPGKDDDTVYLPIDSKFPIEDYLKLVEASENGNVAEIDDAAKKLERRIKEEAASIKQKYIHPPKTTDFAILYLTIEGLYAEVVKRPGLIENLQSQYRVVVCGPTTLAALLNSLQMGFRTVAIEKRSTEIWKLLEQFRKDFAKFNELLNQTKKKLEGVQSTIDDAGKRTELIQKRLSNVGALPDEQTDLIENTASIIGADDED